MHYNDKIRLKNLRNEMYLTVKEIKQVKIL